MPALAIVVLALQIMFAVHAIRNGKESFWLFVIFLFPGIGCAVYFFTQFAPEASNSRAVHQAKKGLLNAVDPQRELKKRTEQLEIANTVENRLALADECAEAGLYDEAIELLEQSLSGVHGDDPRILSRLARAHFESDRPAKSIQILEDLIAKNPSYQSPDEHLLYARALVADGQKAAAVEEYEVLRSSFPGEEARVRYGLLLKDLGQGDKASELFAESQLRAKRAPKHYRKRERQWLDLAAKNTLS